MVEAGMSGAVNGAGDHGSRTFPTAMSGAGALLATGARRAGPRTALPTSDRLGRNGVARDSITGPASVGTAFAPCPTGGGGEATLVDAASRRGRGIGGSTFAS